MTSFRSGRQAGVSLIEILVVLVLLLIGILSVIRLFPPGFLINKHVAEATVAERLSKQEMDRFVNGSSNLPDTILPVVPRVSGGGYVWAVDPGSTPDDLTPADPTSFGIWAPYFSDVNKQRRIFGEVTRIPLPTSTSLGRGSVYMLSSGPFMDVSWDGQTRSIFISGNPMNRVDPLVDTTTTLPPSVALRNNDYTIDYGGKQLAFKTARFLRHYLLNISYYNTSNIVTPLVDLLIDVPANTTDWVQVPAVQLPSDFKSFVPYSDSCARRFVEIAPGTPWSQGTTPPDVDPYEFYLDPVNSPRIGAANSIGANVGVVVFSPLGRTFTEITPSGLKPLTARIDYDVLDWHIIHEDRPLPPSPPFQVSLSLRELKKLGDFEDDQTIYQDLFSGVTRPNSGTFSAPSDFLVYNASTGTFVDPINYVVNYRDGSVLFTDAFGNANASASLRFFYRAHGDWALQIQKASATYKQHLANDAVPSFSEFYLGGWNGGGGQPTRIYFPLSEAGKTVSIREYWYVNGASQKIRVSNETFRINSNRTLFENPSGNQVLTWVDVRDKHSDAASFDATSTGSAVLGMQGISFRTRVLWKNGSSVATTNGANGFTSRWLHADLDTVLTRGAP